MAFLSPAVKAAADKIFLQCNKVEAWQGKRELEQLIEDDKNGISVPGIEDAYTILARVYSGPYFSWVEAGFPEDDPYAYSLLHEGIRRGSALGIMQGMRTTGAMTPTIKKELPMSLDEAFQKVLKGAEKGCPYCAYAIGNAYYWEDYRQLPSAEAAVASNEPSLLEKAIQALRNLFGNSHKPALDAYTAAAIRWFEQAANSGLVIAYGNLGILLRDTEQVDRHTFYNHQAADLGIPFFMCVRGIDAHEAGDKQEALRWFIKAADKGNGGAQMWAADYLSIPIESGREIPSDMERGLHYFELAAQNPDYRDFSNHYYCIHRAVPMRVFHMGGVSQDWHRVAHLLRFLPQDKRQLAINPYITYVVAMGKGISASPETIKDVCQHMLDLVEEHGSFGTATSLWKTAVGYAYEKGYMTGVPDLDTAVTYYQEAHKAVEENNALPPGESGMDFDRFKIDDEAGERLNVFEEVDGHYQYKAGITESSSQYNQMPSTWPQRALALYKSFDGFEYGWRTGDYTWDDVINEWNRSSSISFTIETERPRIFGDTMEFAYRLEMVESPSDGSVDRATVFWYGYQLIDDEYYEMCMGKTMNVVDALAFIKSYYDSPNIELGDDWYLM